MTKTSIDWDRVEIDYRAGVLTLREMGTKHGVAESAIRKRAKRDSWVRDLSAKIKQRADDMVRKDEVRKEVRTEQKISERVEVEASAQVIANVRMAHRGDISRSRRLANMLLDELEGMTEERGTLKELIEQLKDDNDVPDAMLELAQKMASLPNRSKIMKELSETLKTLIGLERQAYSLDSDETPLGGGATITRVERVIIDAPKN